MEKIDKLNEQLPKYFDSARELKEQLQGLGPMLNKFKDIVGTQLTPIESKEGVYQGRKAKMTLFKNGEILIRFADLGQGKKEIDKIK